MFTLTDTSRALRMARVRRHQTAADFKALLVTRKRAGKIIAGSENIADPLKAH
ncbi:MAG: hypothetical protein WAT78_01895 [Rhizobiaceae bacterium]